MHELKHVQYPMFQVPEETDYGKLFQDIREQHGYSRRQVAEGTGLTEATIRSLEDPSPPDTYQHGAGVRMFTIHTLYRFWGFELYAVPTAAFRPACPMSWKNSGWGRLTKRQRYVAEQYVAGKSPQTIAKELGTGSRCIISTLSTPRVALYVQGLKQMSADAVIQNVRIARLVRSGILDQIGEDKALATAKKRAKKRKRSDQ